MMIPMISGSRRDFVSRCVPLSNRFLPAPSSVAVAVLVLFLLPFLGGDASADEGRERALIDALRAATARLPLVLPLHPRGRATLEVAGLGEVPDLVVVDPLGYIDFISLVRGAAVVITDSGGIQEETTVLDVPCLTLRPNTERPITLTAGTNRLVTPSGLGTALDGALAGAQARIGSGPPGWDGHAGERIAAHLLRGT